MTWSSKLWRITQKTSVYFTSLIYQAMLPITLTSFIVRRLRWEYITALGAVRRHSLLDLCRRTAQTLTHWPNMAHDDGGCYLSSTLSEYAHRLESLPQLSHIHLPILVGVELLEQVLVGLLTVGIPAPRTGHHSLPHRLIHGVGAESGSEAASARACLQSVSVFNP